MHPDRGHACIMIHDKYALCAQATAAGGAPGGRVLLATGSLSGPGVLCVCAYLSSWSGRVPHQGWLPAMRMQCQCVVMQPPSGGMRHARQPCRARPHADAWPCKHAGTKRTFTHVCCTVLLYP